MHVGLGLLTLFPRRVGGTETYVRSLLGEFGRGNGPERVTLLANRHVAAEYGDFERGPVSLHHVRSYRAGDSDLTRALAMAAARCFPRLVMRDVPRNIDVLHLPVTVPIPRIERPTVVTVHEVQYHELPENFSAAERRYRRWAYDGSARAATVVIAISRYVADGLVRHAGVDPERIEVVHLAVDHERFRPGPVGTDEHDLDPLALPARFVYYPANLWPHKNHARLLDAFAAVADDSLALVLDGRDYGARGALERRAERLGISERVVHMHADADRVPAIYRAAEATVYPSLHEGFGMPPLEAMACGCPVASTTNTSLAEVCGDAVVALDAEDSAQIASAIARIIEDQGLRDILRARGLERAQRFTWGRVAARHREIYESAAAT